VSESDNIPERVSRLEQSVAEARKDAAAARILAGGADRDVSEMRTELRAHTKTLNALRETQVEQGRELRQGFAGVDERVDNLETELREGFSTMSVGMAQITALLTIAIDKPEQTDES
jgi:chromosome segregation ATPase